MPAALAALKKAGRAAGAGLKAVARSARREPAVWLLIAALAALVVFGIVRYSRGAAAAEGYRQYERTEYPDNYKFDASKPTEILRALDTGSSKERKAAAWGMWQLQNQCATNKAFEKVIGGKYKDRWRQWTRDSLLKECRKFNVERRIDGGFINSGAKQVDCTFNGTPMWCGSGGFGQGYPCASPDYKKCCSKPGGKGTCRLREELEPGLPEMPTNPGAMFSVPNGSGGYDNAKDPVTKKDCKYYARTKQVWNRGTARNYSCMSGSVDLKPDAMSPMPWNNRWDKPKASGYYQCASTEGCKNIFVDEMKRQSWYDGTGVVVKVGNTGSSTQPSVDQPAAQPSGTNAAPVSDLATKPAYTPETKTDQLCKQFYGRPNLKLVGDHCGYEDSNDNIVDVGTANDLSLPRRDVLAAGSALPQVKIYSWPHGQTEIYRFTLVNPADANGKDKLAPYQLINLNDIDKNDDIDSVEIIPGAYGDRVGVWLHEHAWGGGLMYKLGPGRHDLPNGIRDNASSLRITIDDTNPAPRGTAW